MGSRIHLDNKPKYLRKFGPRAAELAANESDVVVGLPDLYPASSTGDPMYRHTNLEELSRVQKRLVMDALQSMQGLRESEARLHLDRLCASAFKHDFEMLLLAAHESLRRVLGTRDRLGSWTIPVEEQDLAKPPKRLVEDLFKAKRRRAYRDTTDAPAVLRRVLKPEEVLYDDGSSRCTCPEFKKVVDWLGARFDCPWIPATR
jgi:hypothetical protein